MIVLAYSRDGLISIRELFYILQLFMPVRQLLDTQRFSAHQRYFIA